MDRFHVIKHPLGGSDVYDSEGKQVGYSLPAIIGEGEDFYDMQGNPVGMSLTTNTVCPISWETPTAVTAIWTRKS